MENREEHRCPNCGASDWYIDYYDDHSVCSNCGYIEWYEHEVNVYVEEPKEK